MENWSEPLRQALLEAERLLPNGDEPGTLADKKRGLAYDRAVESVLHLLKAADSDEPAYSDIELDGRERRRRVKPAGTLEEVTDKGLLRDACIDLCYRERHAIIARLKAEPQGLTSRGALILLKHCDGFTVKEVSGICKARAVKAKRRDWIASERTVQRELACILPRAQEYPYFYLMTLLSRIFSGRG